MNPLSTDWDRHAFPVTPAISFEFFPPSNPEMEEKLWQTLARLAPLAPRFVSVTYGAGGSTRARTQETVTAIHQRLGLSPAGHLTCVAASREEIDDVARRYWQAGVRHIVALRGDAPGGGKYAAHAQGYAHAADLVAGLKKVADFEISVAAHPETHPEAGSADADLDNLKRKVDAGACRGINVPIVPGILPVTNFKQVQQFSARCGASVPRWLAGLFEGLDDDPETRKLVAAHVAGQQCRVLEEEGVQEFHFYTLNS